MFARNSDLYAEVSASSVAFSSSARRASSISSFFALHLGVLLGEQQRPVGQLFVGLLQLLLLGLQLTRESAGIV